MSDLRLRLPPWGALLARRVQLGSEHGRYQRGTGLLRAGAVTDVRTVGGSLVGSVRGSADVPYQVAMAVLPLTEAQVQRVADAVAVEPSLLLDLFGRQDAAAAHALSAGTGVELLPAERNLLHFACTCPDPQEPCKHAVALALAGADLVLDTPALWLLLRGFPLEEVAGDLLAEEDVALEGDPDAYFSPAGEVPALRTGASARTGVEARDADLLRAVLRPDLPRLPRTSRASVEARVDAAVDALRVLYDAVVRPDPPGR
ncbi:hypothetical protein CLV92_10910 [Kineococcus xinjiangensis]|uniref:SWIM-type domain-containing protein n=1 Tax=Kineococcus xinjiangensis TaxID=512762 RepID=A0A2S6IHP4_9ACTN|nr:hypothetical protein [Kineococcus xinjiangensis]PPK93734.1 hypothetical protein CLV92_10910 [Kineococcus xinjiangensis]